MPVQGWLTSLSYSVYDEYRDSADERTDLMTEIVNAIKVRSHRSRLDGDILD